MSNLAIAPWDHKDNSISKEDEDSLKRLIELNDKHNRKKSIHTKVLYAFIACASFTFVKYFFNIAILENVYILDNLLNNKNLVRDLFINVALFFISKFTFDLREKAKEDYHSLRNELVDLSNKEWYKKYGEPTNTRIYEYLYNSYKIRINHKTK
ncbi:DUF2663 family protein [Cytobacillus sp. S13-E01]|uniref:DUF2663 family protein n=1 Tax=Cytobacillus sp. S13-E01 TaxID=3031326 RepID=UPI0023D8186E|nr:DUF2663 family protein [Cytobacillus sp. S13-E01]MDF0725517.1 DUF2663 family protein [Cytobacillus sp. S13-E01]